MHVYAQCTSKRVLNSFRTAVPFFGDNLVGIFRVSCIVCMFMYSALVKGLSKDGVY